MPYYSPLRYPGGKRRLTSTIVNLLKSNDLVNSEYIEPYVGGGSLALSLLMGEYVSKIHINDLCRAVYAFWYSVLNDTLHLCQRIQSTDITMEEWYKQKEVFNNQDSATLEDLGFATFFLNRTNRSGILTGGVIGGKKQQGEYKLDARFNKEELIARILRINKYKDRIALYQLDALELTKNLVINMNPRNCFVFYDPPYITKGDSLYFNRYKLEDHQTLAAYISTLDTSWVVTYDYDASVLNNLYDTNRRLVFGLKYSARDRYEGIEAMFLAENLVLPDTWRPSKIDTHLSPTGENLLYRINNI